MSEVSENKFPVESLLPKSETGALNFLKKYPEFDGRDVTIAIFDSGVDPRAAGLAMTTENAIKVIQRFDCTGCGDLDTTTKVTASADGTIVGLSGRSLKLTAAMIKENVGGGEYRVGLKSFNDLLPAKIHEKQLADAKIKIWDDPHKRIVAEIGREAAAFDAKNPSTSPNLSPSDKLKKEDLDMSVEVLNAFEKKYGTTITTYDCVLFMTKECWVAIIDTTETGDLANGVMLREFSKTQDIKSVVQSLSISMNVHDSGNILELVGMCSSHGTHVSSIASGYHPENRTIDGLAPGAKIVSITIGDGRLGSMETGTALVRAIIKVMELCNAGTRIDVINMSYGEHAHWSNSGRIGDLMNELVNKYGVVWVASAGNHGPALCTVGTPPDISQPSCIGVGAYVSPAMMEAEYALRAKLPGNLYTWTSRDPCIDGGCGVTVCAPGGAITSVPEFTLTRAQLMNGTSMAAPHVAGAVALIISGLKRRGIKYTPFSIKRALWNTAKKLLHADHFGQGNGLLDIERAFENLISYNDAAENEIRFNISVAPDNAKGIHLRNQIITQAKEFNVTIDPVLFNDKEQPPRKKIEYNVPLTLVPSEPWVECGAYLDLCYSARTVVVKVDGTSLSPGVHSATIKAFDTRCIEKGTLFEIPVTAVQPIAVVCKDQGQSAAIEYAGLFKPNTIERHFLLVPSLATWAVLRMISTDSNDRIGGKFMVHTIQILPHKNCKSLETQKMFQINSDTETLHYFKCEGDNILELCMAKFWSSLGESNIKYSLEFHGIKTNNANVMHSALGIHRIDLRTLSTEDIFPVITLKNAAIVIRPSESKISPLGSRDVVPPSRQIYQNVLTFNLHLAKSAELSLYAPLFNEMLYESAYESQFWMLFDSNKMACASGDAYSESNYFKLDKGDYVIKMQIRHEKKDLLESVSEATMVANIKLASNITPKVFKSYNIAITRGTKIPVMQLRSGVCRPIYIAPLDNDKVITKTNVPSSCSWLDGTISFATNELARKVDTAAFRYILTEGPTPPKPNDSSKETKNKLDEYKEGWRDFQKNAIPKLDAETALQVYNDVLNANPTFLAIHTALIQNIDATEPKSHLPFTFKQSLVNQQPSLDTSTTSASAGGNIAGSGGGSGKPALSETLQRIVELANCVINETDKSALLAYYGIKLDNRSDAAKIKMKMDQQKAVLLEAYVRKTIALYKLNLIANTKLEAGRDESVDTIVTTVTDDIYNEIGNYADYTDIKILPLSIWHAFAHQHHGRLAKYLLKFYEDKMQKDILVELRYVFDDKNWCHLSKLVQKQLVTAHPKAYRPF